MSGHLIMNRREKDAILIQVSDALIRIEFKKIRPSSVRLSIEAPKEVKITRESFTPEAANQEAS